MTFYPRGILAFVAFVAVLILAVNARAGRIDTTFAIVGAIAILAIEAALFWGIVSGRTRTR
jgi:hypothetical protein